MKQLTCEMCGSTDLLKQDGIFVCQTCGTKYSVEEAKKMIVEGTVEIVGAVQVDKKNEVDALLKRVFMFLEEGQWEGAEEYCERVLDIDPENPEAYLAKLMREEGIKNLHGLSTFDHEHFLKSNIWIKMLNFADQEFLDKINNCLEKEFDDTLENFIDSNNGILTKKLAKRFFDCDKDASISIPPNVLRIEEHAFENFKMTSINLNSEGEVIIGDFAFAGCRELTTIALCEDESVIGSIGKSAFKNCQNLTSFNFTGVSQIGSFAFSGCTSLSTIEWIDTPFDNTVFEGCNRVCTLKIYTRTSPRIFPQNFFTSFKIEHLCLATCYLENVVKIFDEIKCQSESNIDLTNLKTLSIAYKSPSINSILHYINYIEDYLKEKYSFLSNYESLEYILIEYNYDGDTYKETKYSKQEFFKIQQSNKSQTYEENQKNSSGCYVATCVYGSYDCPEVWALRRFRDDTLGATWYGRSFIYTYYAISPTLVKWFGHTKWFKKMWKGTLDRMVADLRAKGVEDTPYNDKNWR